MDRILIAVLASALPIVMCGCQQHAPQVAAAEPLVVPVSQPILREVTDYVDYTGRTDAVESVGVRARVTGYIDSVPFKEGAEVKKGDVLFVIDPRPYKAQLDQAQGQVDLNQASYKLAQATYQRDLAISRSVAGGVSQQQLDQDKASVDEAQARIKAAQAALEVYRLNLEFTNVTSPIAGMISRYYYTPGNLVIQDQTLLTTVVTTEPMYAYFDMDEPTLLRVRRAINEGRIKLPQPGSDIPILMGLQGETGFPHHGTFNFINNVINPSTGTIAVRGVFPNPRPPNGTRLLTPGMFVRIRLPIGQPHPALLVIDSAVGSDQGLKFVYVVNAQHEIEYRRVTTGPLEDDGLRVIDDGLQPSDWVVTGALQQVRPLMQVSPDEMKMPTIPSGGPQAPGGVNNRAQPPPGGNQPAQGKQSAPNTPRQ